MAPWNVSYVLGDLLRSLLGTQSKCEYDNGPALMVESSKVLPLAGQ